MFSKEELSDFIKNDYVPLGEEEDVAKHCVIAQYLQKLYPEYDILSGFWSATAVYEKGGFKRLERFPLPEIAMRFTKDMGLGRRTEEELLAKLEG